MPVNGMWGPPSVRKRSRGVKNLINTGRAAVSFCDCCYIRTLSTQGLNLLKYVAGRGSTIVPVNCYASKIQV